MERAPKGALITNYRTKTTQSGGSAIYDVVNYSD
jgi:hypothetical protein